MPDKILIIEDERPISRLLDLVLRDEFVVEEIEICETLECAFLYLQEQQTDLIILDLELPPNQSAMVTLQALPPLKAMARCPVVIHTGSNDPNLHKEALAAGADEFAQKGSNFDDLINRIYIAEGRFLRDRRADLAKREALEEHHAIERKKCEEHHAAEREQIAREKQELEAKAAIAADRKFVEQNDREVALGKIVMISVFLQCVLQSGNAIDAGAGYWVAVKASIAVLITRLAEYAATLKAKRKGKEENE